MKRLIFSLLILLALGVSGCQTKQQAKVINGAGATFPYPLYAQWAYEYHSLSKVKLNYQSIGSGGGIAQIKAKTVDFGASDAPMKPEDLDAAGLIQFPMVIGGVVPVVNIEGIQAGELKLTSELIAGIFLGQIVKWDDPRIKSVNPEIELPGTDITVVHRADGSGTTWIFTNYLDKVSKGWHDKVGTGKAVDWPTGVGGKGNEGVAAYVQRVNGSVGYVEFAYALQNNMSHVLIKERAGNFTAPPIVSLQSAAGSADWKRAPGYYVVLTDQAGPGSWPITGASFILIHREQQDPDQAKAMLSFFDWCFKHGAQPAEKLHYVPIPMNVVELVQTTWSRDLNSGGKSVWE